MFPVSCYSVTTMLKRSTSKFDTGNWSEVNGLPGQSDMLNFLRDLASRDKNRCFTRRQLMEEVAQEFQIPAHVQEATGPQSDTAGYYTRLTYLIADAIQGVRRAEDDGAFLRRLEYNVYQHVQGNGIVPVEFRQFARRKQEELPLVETPLEEAIYLIRHAKKIGFMLTKLRTITAEKFDGETWNLAVERA
jgi:hypothetical protein